MLMISSTICFGLDIPLRMVEHLQKLRLLLNLAQRVIAQLVADLWTYYSFPFKVLALKNAATVSVDLFLKIIAATGTRLTIQLLCCS
jgi:hypothetical protein